MNTNIRELILAGAHFGHRIRFGNPQMAPYIYGTYQTHTYHQLGLHFVGATKSGRFSKRPFRPTTAWFYF